MIVPTNQSPVNTGASPLRVLVIGAGPAATAMHLPVLARLRDAGRVVLAHVCDLDSGRATRAQQRFGFEEASGEARAALARTDLNAVFVFGSAQLHCEYGLAALRSGKHLFVEKPIAPTYSQALELAHAAREHGLIAVGGHNRRFYRSLEAVRARAGGAGWRFAEAVFHKAELGRPASFGSRTWLGANGIHALDALVFMMGGPPEELFALAAGTIAPASAFSALLRWADGAQGVFTCNNEAGSRREEYVFHAPGETCTVSASGVSIQKGGNPVNLPLPMEGDGIEAEHEAFLQAIRSGAHPIHSIGALAPSLYLAERIEAGHCGHLPAPPMVRVRSIRKPRQSQVSSILVVHPADLQSPLARTLSEFPLVTLHDIQASPGPRADVTAAILGRGAIPLTPEILGKLPSLAVIGVVGLSISRHAPEALLARGIALVNASTAYADSVAEFALGLAILGRRCAFRSHELMRHGGWGTDAAPRGWRGALKGAASRLRPWLQAWGLESPARGLWNRAGPALGIAPVPAPRARELRNARIGLIGWGANAQAFCERLRGAGAYVLVYSEHAEPAQIAAAGGCAASLGEVLAADVVSLHRGLSNQTRHCLGAAELSRLRPGAVLINVARGALIEPDALLARLRRGDVFACLDTYPEEPPPASDPLRRLPNVFLTSHIAGGSADMHAAAAEEVVQKIAACLAGRFTDMIPAERLETMT
jgi:phosphoglycerate dehydrogenase-like enzyme/predicted dehydrogenase